jgi:AAA family ATP:ADP antiporter
MPIEPLLIFQAKAWIDMFEHRLFNVLGSVLILLFTQWLPWSVDAVQLGWLVLTVCAFWWLTLFVLRRESVQVRPAAAEY